MKIFTHPKIILAVLAKFGPDGTKQRSSVHFLRLLTELTGDLF